MAIFSQPPEARDPRMKFLVGDVVRVIPNGGPTPFGIVIMWVNDGGRFGYGVMMNGADEISDMLRVEEGYLQLAPAGTRVNIAWPGLFFERYENNVCVFRFLLLFFSTCTLLSLFLHFSLSPVYLMFFYLALCDERT